MKPMNIINKLNEGVMLDKLGITKDELYNKLALLIINKANNVRNRELL